jgi:hypothetical protein
MFSRETRAEHRSGVGVALESTLLDNKTLLFGRTKIVEKGGLHVQFGL